MALPKVTISNDEFTLVDELDGIAIVDSFVRENKIGTGNGEARLYVGQQGSRDWNAFFEGFNFPGIFLKRDFAVYLNDARFEYENQEQGYRNDISGSWQPYVNKLVALPDQMYFVLENATGAQDSSRYYIRCPESEIADRAHWDYFREIALPIITSISILKLLDEDGNYLYYFRPSLEYSFNPYYHPAVIEKEEDAVGEQDQLADDIKLQIIQARRGQGKYRSKLLDESSECIITRVNDERILIASHIKPWSVSSNTDRINHHNGLLLTPTYDKLFDQGFISFDNEARILISPYISASNIEKLQLVEGTQFAIPQMNRRTVYLEYHRQNIFKS